MIRSHYYLPLILAVVIGCGDGRVKLPTAPVAGSVSYQGKPLTKGRIIFFHPSGQAAAADLAADGTFKLAAFQGKNQVAIECLAPRSTEAQTQRAFCIAGQEFDTRTLRGAGHFRPDARCQVG